MTFAGQWDGLLTRLVATRNTPINRLAAPNVIMSFGSRSSEWRCYGICNGAASFVQIEHCGANRTDGGTRGQTLQDSCDQ